MNSSAQIVLVEDDLLVRFIWQSVAKEKGYDLFAYESVNEFLTDINLFSQTTKFYLDQDIGPDRGAGVRLARLIKQKFGAYTHLVTHHCPSLFTEEVQAGVLDQVSGKFPYPFNNPFSATTHT